MKTYHKNPRQIKDKQFKDLRAWLLELGDLSGIVHDLNSDEVISGNQRMRAIDIAKCEIVLVDGPHDPDAQGTVAHGYVIWQGAKYNYRQVRWTERQCEKANIVANKAGGTWDFDTLANGFEMDDLLEWGFEPQELGIGADITMDYEPEESANKGLKDITFSLTPDQMETVEGALSAIEKEDNEYPGNDHKRSNALYYLACWYAEAGD